jgi:hypothetical protein
MMHWRNLRVLIQYGTNFFFCKLKGKNMGLQAALLELLPEATDWLLPHAVLGFHICKF